MVPSKHRDQRFIDLAELEARNPKADIKKTQVLDLKAPLNSQLLPRSSVFSMSKAFFSADREQKSLFGKMKMPKGKAPKAEIRKSAVKHRGVQEGTLGYFFSLPLCVPFKVRSCSLNILGGALVRCIVQYTK